MGWAPRGPTEGALGVHYAFIFSPGRDRTGTRPRHRPRQFLAHPAPAPASAWCTRPRPRPRHGTPVPGPGPGTWRCRGRVYLQLQKNQIIFPKNANFFRFLVLRANCQQRFFVGDLHRAISNWKFFRVEAWGKPKVFEGSIFYCNNRENGCHFCPKTLQNHPIPKVARCSVKHQIFLKDLENVDQKSTIFGLFRLFSQIWIWKNKIFPISFRGAAIRAFAFALMWCPRPPPDCKCYGPCVPSRDARRSRSRSLLKNLCPAENFCVRKKNRYLQ